MAALPKPDVPDGPVRDLFEALHALHHRAGWPSLRDIAKDVGCSHTTVSAAFAGPKVPRWGLLELIVESLSGDPEAFHRRWLAATASAPPLEATSTADVVRPRQLIADVAGFVGRDDALAGLDGLLDEQVPIVAISGTAGVGKTAFAVRWAHRVADRFPDGQLFLNLHGFHPTERPVSTGHAVRSLLDAFDVAPQRVPGSLDAQLALYRSVLAGRRVLVLLDNARDAEQVRPLLPGTAGCLTLVTSRDQLAGLVAAEGARPLPLELMPPAEARELIARRIGDARARAEPLAVDRIVARCARLPLALAVVAARAATHPRFALDTVADELHAALGSLDPFTGTDLATDVRAVLSWSYVQLSPEAARLFRLLGLHPGPDLAAPAAAALAGSAGIGGLLAELVRTNLVAEHTPGRYRLHDLLRAYAAELLHASPDDDRRAALRRLLDHHLHAAHRAALALNPSRHPITLDPATLNPAVWPGTEALSDPVRARAWLTAERPALLALARLAAADRFDRHTWQLAWTLTTFLDRRGDWDDWLALQCDAVAAAGRLRDPEGEAYARRGLGLAHYRLGHYAEARAELALALDRFADCGDTVGQAHTRLDTAWVLERQNRYGDALAHAEAALELLRAAGSEPGQASALNAAGWFAARLDDYPTAMRRCQEALGLFRRLGDTIGEAATLDSIGYAQHRLGEYQESIESYRRAITMFRRAGDRFHEAESLANLGDTFDATADADSAHREWQCALSILDELGHPQAAVLRVRLTPVG